MSGKRKTGRRVYTFFLLLYAVILCFAAWFALKMVWTYAEEYEYSRPARTLNSYLDMLNRERWSDGIAEAVAAMPHETQSDEEIRGFIQERLSSGVTAIRKSGSNDTIVYSLRCNGGEIGTVTLTEDTGYRTQIDTTQFPWKLLSWHIQPWRVSGESFNFDSLYQSVETVVPAGYQVWVNGVQLGEEYIVERDIPFDVYEEYYQYWDTLPTKLRYRFDHVIGEPEILIRDANGQPVEIDPEQGDIQFVPPMDEDSYNACADFAREFMVRYLRYVAGVSGMEQTRLAELRQYLLPGSDIEKRMLDALDGLSWGHTVSITVDDVRVNSVLELTEGYTVVDVEGDTTTFAYGKGEEQRTISLRVMLYYDGERLWAESMHLY